jgi:4-hydroxy-tetrahydrodipicolinate synthase
MTPRFQPQGAWTALVTPFTAAGEFDAHTYARLLEFQLAEGIFGLVPCGTTGESPTLSWEEQGTAVALAVRLAEGRAGVLAGTGSNSTQEAIEGTRDAWSRGVNAALLVDCYYNGPSSLELRREYYERVLSAVPELPIVPYVIPGRTGCVLGSEDLAILHLQDPLRVPAVKSATGDIEQMKRDRLCAGPTLSILSGDDELTLGMMSDPAIAAAGVISVIANVAPRAVSVMCEAARTKDTVKAEALNRALAPLFPLVTFKVPSERVLPDGRRMQTTDRFRNPVPVKAMMAGLGMLSSALRPPLGLMTAQAVAACRQALRTVHGNNPEVLQPIEAAFGVSIARRLDDDGVWSALVAE